VQGQGVLRQRVALILFTEPVHGVPEKARCVRHALVIARLARGGQRGFQQCAGPRGVTLDERQESGHPESLRAHLGRLVEPFQ
jgi:hypothetical protein